MRHALPALIPELLVSDLVRSRAFWCDLIGFSVLYDRPEDRFAMLGLGGAAVMLEQRQPGVRQWMNGPLDAPFGRGLNFQIEVAAVTPIIDRLAVAEYPLFMGLDESWYRIGNEEHGQRQFVVQDPDGYLLRLAEGIGRRAAASGPELA